MTAFIIIGAIVFALISIIVEEGDFFSKLALSALVAALAFLLLWWVTGWELMTTLAKLGAAVTILSTLWVIIRKIAG